MLCEYPGTEDDPTLGRHMTSPGSDDAVTALRDTLRDDGVAAAPGGVGLCRRPQARYLARFDLAGGSVWVGTAPCITTNGRITSVADHADDFAAALDALLGPVSSGAASDTPVEEPPPTDDPFGGNGDPAFDACLETTPSFDPAVAPPAPQRADVCHKPPAGASATSVDLGAADATRLAAALRASPVVADTGCRHEDDQWLLDFHAADDLGAAVFVDAGCRTARGDGGAVVGVDEAFLTLLRSLD